jgi:hypothetical protein
MVAGYLTTPEPYETPLTIPSAGVFDSPNVHLCINAQWATILDGLVGQLLTPAIWDGSELDVDEVIQQVHLLLVALGINGECP